MIWKTIISPLRSGKAKLAQRLAADHIEFTSSTPAPDWQMGVAISNTSFSCSLANMQVSMQRANGVGVMAFQHESRPVMTHSLSALRRA